MKKSIFVLFVMIALLLIMAGFQSVYAIDLNLINSVRENEITSAQNLAIDNTTGTYNNAYSNSTYNAYNTYNTYTPESQTFTTISNTPDTPPTTVVGNTTTTASNTLTIGNILSILLIVVGLLLIFLGIAILIRMKH